MALSYCVLASGSSGNSVWVRGGGIQILVDCGLSARMIGRKLAEAGGRVEDLTAVVCTHGHTDHVLGASVLAKRFDLDIWATPGTALALPSGMPRERLRQLPFGGSVQLGGLTVRTVPTSHDAPEAVAIRIEDHEQALGIVTDLGIETAPLVKAFQGLDGLVIESNHDLTMLQNGPYPERLKKRIRGNWGHLSNEQGARLLEALLHDGLQHVTLGHVSAHNNTPDLALAATARMLERRGGATPAVAVAVQGKLGTPISLGVRVAARSKVRQLFLPFR